MKLVHGLLPSINERPTILTIGVFDGMHLGHQHLIGTTVRRARERQFQSAVLTFDPHPDIVIRPDRPKRYLASLDERIDHVRENGADVLIILPFNDEVKRYTAHVFMEHVCRAVALRELHIGWDFALGFKREGTFARLSELGQTFGYTVHPVEALLYNGEPVSSSRVRNVLDDGDVTLAAELLGRSFALSGTITEGDKRGRTIGFPTANIPVDSNRVVPANGVYVCRAMLNNHAYNAVTNIGVRPTFDGQQRTIEAHLLDFTGDIYGETLQLHFLHRLRGEQKFNGISELVTQINRDVETASAWLQQHPST